MFVTSDPILFFDYFRVPYEVRGRNGTGAPRPATVRAEDTDRTLSWPRWQHDAAAPEAAEWSVDGVPLYARVASSDEAPRWLPHEKNWRQTRVFWRADGRVSAAIWEDASGNVFLPFDPDEAIQNLWSEAYLGVARNGPTLVAKRVALRSYYRARPLLPRPAQIAARRIFSRIQARTRFPRWPVEPALHDLYGLLFRWAEEVAGAPVPWIAPWPNGSTWALVLTHDVETEVGYHNVDRLREVEEKRNYRSSWNFVPFRYTVADDVVEQLLGNGFEVGVHGLYHDGRDLESDATLTERLPHVREYAERWRATGFRSPSTLRNWKFMPRLGFDYDSSYPDTDPFEPQGGGCCTWLPFFNDGLVELPITLPQDHTLFTILGETDEKKWLEKARYIRSRGGLVLLDTHPDYMLDAEPLDAYGRFLEAFRADTSVWHALPRDVAAWWRRRAQSSLVRRDGDWTVDGPAAEEATIRRGLDD